MEHNGHRAGLSADQEDKESARTDRITRPNTIAQEDVRKLIVRAIWYSIPLAIGLLGCCSGAFRVFAALFGF